MRKTVKNCRSLNMQTIRVRRNRPASISIAFALAITMLIVYLLTLQGGSEPHTEAASVVRSEGEIHLSGMEIDFLASSIHDDRTQAHVAAAICAQNGGAGLVLDDGGKYAVVHASGNASGGDMPVIHRGESGLSMKIVGPAGIISAISDGTGALYAMAQETESLADSTERGETSAQTIASLLGIYRTQLEKSLGLLSGVQNPKTALICASVRSGIDRLSHDMENPNPGTLRLIHAESCLQWMELLKNLKDSP